ncbi:MAG: GNAT family N-acetyltransferase [Deltaproteobacteria bacterium]|nr:GNAT family N-acetyltransferase [Deltaproteobacteria bacterium]
MNLRCAKYDDAFAIARVHVNSWRAAYRGLVPDDRLAKLDYFRGAEAFRKSILEGKEDFYVAEEKGDVIGFLAIGACPDPDVDQKITREVLAIYLAPEFWRKGIGGALYREGEGFLRSRGYLRVVLWAFKDNERAQRFYEAVGFLADGATRVLNVGAPLDTIRYSKDIKECMRFH